jgi:xylulokinase
MEGVVFALRDALDVVRSLSRTGHDVVLAGGGSRSPLWRQIMADIFGMPVRPSLVVDQSAVGAALLAASCDMGTPASQLGKEWARFDRSVEPVPANMARYEELRGIFRDIYPAHAAHFHRLAEFD